MRQPFPLVTSGVLALLLGACAEPSLPLTSPETLPAALLAADDVTIPVDFVKGKGADASDDALDKALAKINEVFAGAGITFKKNTVSQFPDSSTAPRTPVDHGPNAPFSKDEQSVADAGVKTAGQQPGAGKLVVVIVEDLVSSNGRSSAVGGKTVVGAGPVVIADPFHVEGRSLGAVPFWIVLAHELAHALGLTHRVLPSDKNYQHQKAGRYTAPNLMGDPEGATDTELTKDQIDVLKAAAPKFK